jgi:hypothetical protein
MVFLSGKNKLKDPIQQTIAKKLFDPYLNNEFNQLKENIHCVHTIDPFYRQLIHVFERIPVTSAVKGDLSYQFKTIIKIKPEYELYHTLFGKTKLYDAEKLRIIQECISKKYTITKIKSMFTICHK